MFTQAALVGIRFYQHSISPHKGFRCAHSVLHGGTGCSGFAKQAIAETGLWRALPTIRQRFRDCRLAFETLRSEAPVDENARKRRAKRREGCMDATCIGCEGCTLVPRSCTGASAARAGASSKFCDVNPCDGDMGCGGIDICSCG